MNDIVASANMLCNAEGLAAGFDWTDDKSRRRQVTIAPRVGEAIARVNGGMRTIEDKARAFLLHVTSKPSTWYGTRGMLANSEEEADRPRRWPNGNAIAAESTYEDIMSAATAAEESSEVQPTNDGRRQAIRLISLVLWGLIIGYEVVATGQNPSFANVVTTVAFMLLFGSVNLQMWLQHWSGNRNWRRVMSKLHGSSYISDAFSLPNRNYLLAELRREMPRARSASLPFVLVQVSLDTIDQIRRRRGNDYADRAITSLAEVLRRITRNSDFIAHTGGQRFVLCSREQCANYLQRVPSMVAVSPGRHMFDVATAARISEYDMESLYATDVLRDVEEAAPLRRREEKRAFTEAA